MFRKDSASVLKSESDILKSDSRGWESQNTLNYGSATYGRNHE